MASTLTEQEARKAAEPLISREYQDTVDYDPDSDLWYIGRDGGTFTIIVHPDGRLEFGPTYGGILFPEDLPLPPDGEA